MKLSEQEKQLLEQFRKLGPTDRGAILAQAREWVKLNKEAAK